MYAMTMPPRKPSDDDDLWQGIPVTKANRRFLYDVLGLVMADMKRNDGRSPPMSFQQYRKMVYGHIDALAREVNASSSFTNIDTIPDTGLFRIRSGRRRITGSSVHRFRNNQRPFRKANRSSSGR